MTSVDQHFGSPANHAELLGATHAWRAILRQASAQISCLKSGPSDRTLRIALEDVVGHLNKASGLLTQIGTVLDPDVVDQRRGHVVHDLDARARDAQPVDFGRTTVR
jgi:hypothetical protein